MENLRLLRKEKGYTCESLGAIVGVQKSAMSKYERGEIQPSQEVLLKLAETLDTTTDYLLGVSNTYLNIKKEYQEVPPDIQEFTDLLISIGVRQPDKVLSPKAKMRLFNLIKNNANLIVEFEEEFK